MGPTQLPEVHTLLVMQSALVAQLAGQPALPPPHRSPLHPPAGMGVVPLPSTVHVPLAVAPFAAEQLSQAPAHGLLQQKPSTQESPDLHTVQVEGSLQSDAGTQAAPWSFWSTQAPAAEQNLPGAQSASAAQLVGQVPLAPVQTYAPQAVPLPTGTQVPSLTAPAATLHASHPPVQADVQHTESTQVWPGSMHSPVVPHAPPVSPPSR